MKITVQELLGALNLFSQYLTKDARNYEGSIPTKSLVVSTIYLLKKFDNEKSSLPGVTSSISQWAFNPPEYDIALGQYNTEVAKLLKTKAFTSKIESCLSDTLNNLQIAQANGTKYTGTPYEYNLSVTYIAEFTFMVFLFLALSIQINTGALNYISSFEAKSMCQVIGHALSRLEDHTYEWSDGQRYRKFTNSRQFKSLLVYTKSIRRI